MSWVVFGQSSNSAADGLHNVANAATAAGDAAFAASSKFLDAAAMNGKLDRVTFGLLQEQTQRYQEELDALNASNAAMDERAQFVSSLTARYNLLRAAQIETRANARLEQQHTTTTSSSGSSSGGVSRIEVELKVAGAGALNAEELRKNKQLGLDVARELIPHINRLIGRGVHLGG